MSHLTRHDYASALELLAQLEQVAGDPRAFVRALLDTLGELVASEQAALSTCDLGCGPADACLATTPAPSHYRAAIPLAIAGGKLLRIELRRRQRPFSERDLERLALLQPHLAYLYRQACTQAAAPAPIAIRPASGGPLHGHGTSLTRREVDVMQWVACGKIDADIAILLGVSPRTVHKHLEHIYQKLGVETRTAAVMAMQRGTQRAAVRMPT